jgi:glycosyltransferase involved in cell wall biosynthesis
MKPKIALCMIVKNESHIIHECLNSVYKHIDYWVVSDTGSTDGTQDIIKNFFQEKGIPGELHQDEWKNFGHNRSVALRHCDGKAEYAWMIDADDVFEGNFTLPDNTTIDGFVIRMGRPEFSWWRTQIFKVDSKWEYKGVLHEYPSCPKEQPILAKLEGNYFLNARTLGARNVGISAVEKYTRDAEVLEQALVEEPTNTRYQFYLGQSYFDSQQWEKAEQAYIKRAHMGGWPEEVYYSLYRVAICRAMMDKPWPEIQASFLDAYNSRPVRAEPLYHIAQVLRTKFNQPAAAFVFARAAAEIPLPKDDILFVANSIYDYAILDELGATAFYASRPEIGYLACKKLLEEGKIPKNEIPRVQQNFDQYKKLLDEIAKQQQQIQQQINKIQEEKVKTTTIKFPKYKEKKKASR